MTFDAEEVLSKLSNGEKAALLSGNSSILPFFNKHARMNSRDVNLQQLTIFCLAILSTFVTLYTADTYTQVLTSGTPTRFQSTTYLPSA